MDRCGKCGKEVEITCGYYYYNGYHYNKLCKSCLKKNTNRNSGNEKIDNVIKEVQEAQLKRIYSARYDILGHLSEWIPYKQLFCNIRETICLLSKWKNGPLHCSDYIWERKPNKKVHLKCLYDSQNITDEFLNEVGDEIPL